MIETFKRNWQSYLIEAWTLGMLMGAICLFVILMEHPGVGLNQKITSAFLRRLLIAFGVGITVCLVIYSKWGTKSGAHMNPAFTLANYQLNRISLTDAVFYIIFQCLGAVLFMYLLKWLAFDFIEHPNVTYAATVPGHQGIAVAFVAEAILAFVLFGTVLIISNSKLATYTGYAVGFLVFLFIVFEAPLSGMSINPARSLGSAIPSHIWTSFWVYLVAPVGGMQLAAYLYRRWYLSQTGECRSIDCFMSGKQHQNAVYYVTQWFEKKQTGELDTHVNKIADN
jgi:aquaporin Z